MPWMPCPVAATSTFQPRGKPTSMAGRWWLCESAMAGRACRRIYNAHFRAFFQHQGNRHRPGAKHRGAFMDRHGGALFWNLPRKKALLSRSGCRLLQRKPMPKILVVDDELNVQRAFEEILSARGHEVASVPRGGRRLSAFEKCRIRSGHSGHLSAWNKRLGCPGPDQANPADAARDRHDRPEHDRQRHRSHETRGIRLPAKAL